jgi:hypothetical protein
MIIEWLKEGGEREDDLNYKIDFEEFSKYIFSIHCNIVCHKRSDQYQDMNGPITEYFICSSRNSLQFYNYDPEEMTDT